MGKHKQVSRARGEQLSRPTGAWSLPGFRSTWGVLTPYPPGEDELLDHSRARLGRLAYSDHGSS